MSSRIHPVTIVRSVQMPYESSHTLGDEITPDVVKEEFKDSDPHWSLYETPYPQKRKQKYCCCFTSRGLCMSVCVTFWLVFIAVLGVAAFLLFPRIPKITIGSPYLPIDTRGPQFNSTGGKLDTVQYRVNINFTVDSSNYIDIFCSEIAVNGNLKTADDKEISNAFAIGGVQNALFPAFKKVTYSMPIDLYYRSTGARIREDPALMMLLDTVLSEPMGIIKAVYKIRITIPLISWTGFILKFEENLSFDLGAVAANDQSQIQDLVNQIFNAIG